MIHLIDDIRADYSFTGDSLSTSRDSVIYLNDLRHYEETKHVPPTMVFEGLGDALSQFGDFSTLMETLFLIEGDLYLMMDEDDINLALVHHVMSIWPNISLEKLIVVLKSAYIHHSYVRVKNSPHDGALLKLANPTLKYIEGLYDKVTVEKGYTPEMKRHIGFEYLLAHSLATNFDEQDDYVKLFAAKVDRLLWTAAGRDYVKRRMSILFNAYQIQDIFDIPLDLEREDIDRQFKTGDAQTFFDITVGYKDVQYLKDHYSQIRPILDKIDHFSGITEQIEREINQRLDPTKPLTVAQVKELVELDMENGWSFLFGREKMTRDTNVVFISYLYTAPKAELREFIIRP